MVDGVQNVEDVDGNSEGGMITVSFTRGLFTGDDSGQDFQFTEANDYCAYLLISWGGNVNDGSLTAHAYREIRPQKVCFTGCDAIGKTLLRDVSQKK